MPQYMQFYSFLPLLEGNSPSFIPAKFYGYTVVRLYLQTLNISIPLVTPFAEYVCPKCEQIMEVLV